MADADTADVAGQQPTQPARTETETAATQAAAAAAWHRTGITDPDQQRVLDQHGISAAEVAYYHLGAPIASGALPVEAAAATLAAFRVGTADETLIRLGDRGPAERARATRDVAFHIRRRAGELRPPPPPPAPATAGSETPQPTTAQLETIAGAAIRRYEQILQSSGDTDTAWSYALSRSVEVHAAPRQPGRAATDIDGAPKLPASEVRSLAAAAVGLYSGYLHDRRLPTVAAWDQTFQDLLEAWAPPGMRPREWALHERIQQVVGTRQQRADLDAVLGDLNTYSPWMDRLPRPQAKILQRAMDFDMARPIAGLRATVASAAMLLQQRPPDRTRDLTDVYQTIGKLTRLRGELEARLATHPRQRQAVVDCTRGLEQVRQRLQELEPTRTGLEAEQRARLAWDRDHADDLARAEATAVTLRARERALLTKLQATPPRWLHRALGSPPPPSAYDLRERWRQRALQVLQWRVDHAISDQDHALGPVPDDSTERVRYQQLTERLERSARSSDRASINPRLARPGLDLPASST